MELNEEKLTTSLNEFSETINIIQPFIDEVVTSNTGPLDNIMSEVYNNIIAPGVETASVEMIEEYFLELSNCIYFMNEKADRLGIYDAISKISYKEEYNNNYLNPTCDKAKPTVAELTASAENNSIYSQSVNEIYNKAFKIVKGKIDSAQVMVTTLSKVLSRRMGENNLSAMQPTTGPKALLG